MPSLPDAIVALISALGKLPGIGPRSAERLALHLVQANTDSVKQLAEAIVQGRERVHFCSVCGALTEQSPCGLCSDSRRDASLLCVIERPVDVLTLEKSGTFRGRYHVLGGKLSPMNGVGPEDLRLGELELRLGAEPIKEIVLALASDVEGEATTFYLAKRLARPGLKITRIAHGLPAGTGIEYADEVTLGQALEGRRELS